MRLTKWHNIHSLTRLFAIRQRNTHYTNKHIHPSVYAHTHCMCHVCIVRWVWTNELNWNECISLHNATIHEYACIEKANSSMMGEGQWPLVFCACFILFLVCCIQCVCVCTFCILHFCCCCCRSCCCCCCWCSGCFCCFRFPSMSIFLCLLLPISWVFIF